MGRVLAQLDHRFIQTNSFQPRAITNIMTITGFFHLSLLLLALGLTERSLGLHSDRLSSFLALLALLPIAIHLIWGRNWRNLGDAALLLLTFAGIGVWFTMSGPAGFFALAASWAWLAIALQRSYPDRAPSANMLAVVTFGYAVFVTVRDHLTLWPFLSNASEEISLLVSAQECPGRVERIARI